MWYIWCNADDNRNTYADAEANYDDNADSALAPGDNMVKTALMLFIVICPCNACPCYKLSTVALHLELKFVNSAEQTQDWLSAYRVEICQFWKTSRNCILLEMTSEERKLLVCVRQTKIAASSPLEHSFGSARLVLENWSWFIFNNFWLRFSLQSSVCKETQIWILFVKSRVRDLVAQPFWTLQYTLDSLPCHRRNTNSNTIDKYEKHKKRHVQSQPFWRL